MARREPTVFVVDDDASVRDSLAFLLQTVGLQVRTFASATDFLAAYDPQVPGCLILDVRMPGMSGLELQQELVRDGSGLPVIFLTAHGDVPMAVHAVQAGAADFLLKPFHDQDLLDKVQAAIERNAELRARDETRAEVAARLASLTPRERQVMERVIDGRANKVIAADLGISQRTVEIHRARVMEKMRAGSVAELVHLADRAGVMARMRPQSAAA